MPLPSNCRIASRIVLLMLASAMMHCASAQEDTAACEPRTQKLRPPSSAAPESETPAILRRKREPQPEDEQVNNLPTDDFGQPLRGCDVPWDFVPSKR